MKIGNLSMCKAKSMLVNSITDFTKCLNDSVNERTGYSWYRGVIYSYEENIFVGLLGADVEGRFRFIEIVYDGSGFVKDVKGINQKMVCEGIERLLSSIEKLPTPISKIYFDFNERVDVACVKCYMFDDLSEQGSQIMMIETDKSMVDMYMLKSAFNICKGTLLCDNWFEVYDRLSVFSNTYEEIEWFGMRGVKVV